MLTHSLNLNQLHEQNIIFTKIVITNFLVELRKLSFMSFGEIQIMKDPDSLGVQKHNFWHKTFQLIPT